ncbi:MAG: hypothetical protein WBD01_14130, partial [Salaquimonas sp.]
AFMVLSMTSTAFAGNAVLTKGNEKIKLWCNNGGCFIGDFVNAFKVENQKRIGEGGSANFKKIRANYKANGWS